MTLDVWNGSNGSSYSRTNLSSPDQTNWGLISTGDNIGDGISCSVNSWFIYNLAVWYDGTMEVHEATVSKAYSAGPLETPVVSCEPGKNTWEFSVESQSALSTVSLNAWNTHTGEVIGRVVLTSEDDLSWSHSTPGQKIGKKGLNCPDKNPIAHHYTFAVTGYLDGGLAGSVLNE